MLLRCVFTTKCFPRVSNLSSLCISTTFHICGRVSTFFSSSPFPRCTKNSPEKKKFKRGLPISSKYTDGKKR
ncbi:BEM_collapsed_G0055540.mRNA.1.CDS.1 [Saccharomyces cerevisiae]|nr:BEM_HP_G0047080.mRNA.1.CDS.1 [Saccharomyces cerevisiae]CAI6957766.1 BEM_HP_G0047080.mRNA.1.CDS.1 [Saccharomyces cerevisiae]CAI7384626.1 BEM_collapsed_G0055540.mRNA.1.CDS.1 [Saccharomyces cerevisiae]